LQRENFHWYCMKCNSGVGKMLKVVMKMQVRMDVVEDCVRKVDEKIEKIRDGIMTEMNKAFEKVNKNMKELEWLIKLNINKCKVVSYGRNIDHNYPYHINGVQLKQLDSIEDLGVNFDSQLKFYKHIDDKINRA